MSDLEEGKILAVVLYRAARPFVKVWMRSQSIEIKYDFSQSSIYFMLLNSMEEESYWRKSINDFMVQVGLPATVLCSVTGYLEPIWKDIDAT